MHHIARHGQFKGFGPRLHHHLIGLSGGFRHMAEEEGTLRSYSDTDIFYSSFSF